MMIFTPTPLSAFLLLNHLAGYLITLSRSICIKKFFCPHSFRNQTAMPLARRFYDQARQRCHCHNPTNDITIKLPKIANNIPQAAA